MKIKLVLLKDITSYGIWDTQEECYIGFQKYKENYKGDHINSTCKSVWKGVNHAKSAFKLHTNVKFDNQSRYVIKEIK